MKLVRTLLKGIPIIVSIFIVIELIVTNHLAGLGDNVASIDQKIQELQEDNERLELTIASASAMTTIADRASSLGFVEPKHILTIGPEQSSVAIAPDR